MCTADKRYPRMGISKRHSVGIEIMQGLSSSLGVVLTIPATALIVAVYFGRK